MEALRGSTAPVKFSSRLLECRLKAQMQIDYSVSFWEALGHCLLKVFLPGEQLFQVKIHHLAPLKFTVLCIHQVYQKPYMKVKLKEGPYSLLTFQFGASNFSTNASSVVQITVFFSSAYSQFAIRNTINKQNQLTNCHVMMLQTLLS